VGPAILARDRFDYSSAVADSWKRQTLLNIVKLRYLDSPIFLDVAQIVSGYQLQTTVSASGTASVDPSSVPTIGSFLNFGAQGSFTDRPTITYVPLTGDQYIRGIVTPLRPEQVFSAILAGWPAEALLFTAVNTLNGLGNQRLGGVAPRAADPRFLRVVRLMGSLQASSAVGFRFAEGKQPATRTILFFRRAELSERERQEIDEVRQLLHLDREASEFELVFGPTPASGVRPGDRRADPVPGADSHGGRRPGERAGVAHRRGPGDARDRRPGARCRNRPLHEHPQLDGAVGAGLPLRPVPGPLVLDRRPGPGDEAQLRALDAAFRAGRYRGEEGGAAAHDPGPVSRRGQTPCDPNVLSSIE
jgi:hypothetical protein